MNVRLFITRLVTKKLLRFITAEDVLRVVNREVYFGESKLSDEEIGLLREEANAFKDSMLWKFMRRNLDYLANQKLANQATSLADVQYGHSMFHIISVIDTFINKLRTL